MLQSCAVRLAAVMKEQMASTHSSDSGDHPRAEPPTTGNCGIHALHSRRATTPLETSCKTFAVAGTFPSPEFQQRVHTTSDVLQLQVNPDTITYKPSNTLGIHSWLYPGDLALGGLDSCGIRQRCRRCSAFSALKQISATRDAAVPGRPLCRARPRPCASKVRTCPRQPIPRCPTGRGIRDRCTDFLV